MKKFLKRYKSSLIIVLAFIFICLFSFEKVNSQVKYPQPTNLKYVNDYVGILDNSSKEYIVSVGKELEDKTGAQAVVVIIDSLKEEEIRNYGARLFRNWGIGQKDKDNGLLILLSMKEKRWSVEVGRGLEGALPDILTNRVMEEVAIPEFKKNDFSKGIKNAYSVFSDYIGKEYGVSLEKNEKINFNYEKGTSRKGSSMPLYIVVGLIFIDIVFNRARVIRFIIQLIFWNSFFGGGPGGRGGGPWGGGGSSGGGFGGFGGGDTGGGGSSGGW
ncbi:TPM domain-containing protein [Clostridium sp. MB40-C1]|uniref:TPM domain-containing protein n=1 Tax=Clostridium sp. MB40-C1 TaxID=3070996 RepID=UPI0027E152A2|nr:TPM domain-containing protein [Clostridium sp. MB40-C1]WMJ80754.1 TPM domain-containing protein [Clostridium sp. MB40-C1]